MAHPVIICLPLRETYIVFPSVYVRPSVRPSVRASVRLSVTLSCPSHISKNLSCKKFAKNSKNNIPTEVVQQKNQNSILPKNLEVLAKKKTLFKFVFCLGQISVTIHPRIAGVLCSVSEDIPIVQRWSYFFKMLDFGSFLAIFEILVSKIVLFLILSLMQNSIHLITNFRPGFANNYSTVGV